MTTIAHPGPFPEQFIFGAATAAYQIEGAHNKDGRKPSIWDAFSHIPGRVHNGDTGSIACDHYHRWEEDLDLMQAMNLDAYRFSFAWPRILPDGTGAVNSKGLAFYDKLIDGMLERRLRPFATLYHWDLPIQLQGHGGWTQSYTAHAFAEYAQMIAKHFGDRLETVTTLNEPWCSSILSYLYGIHAPGETSIQATVAAIHQQHVGHGLAVQAMRAEKSDLALGIALNLHSVIAANDQPQEQQAAQRFFDFHNGSFLDPIFRGYYPESYLQALAAHLPVGWQDDLDKIKQPLDFWGLNYYTPARVKNDSKAPYPACKQRSPKDCEVTDIGWEIAPQAFSDLLFSVYRDYELPPCYITENGACYNDQPVAGSVNDDKRTQYLADHIEAVRQVMDEGHPVKGYFAWSLLDNFEWAEGYNMRFGLVHVDYETQQRTVKNSGLWYGQLAANHRSDSK